MVYARGKVVVYSGILPITQSESGLAVVMGHEIALSAAIQSEPKTRQNIFMAVHGLGSTIEVIIPISRTQESEADRLRLIFMAMAGYNPNTALNFWTRMSHN